MITTVTRSAIDTDTDGVLPSTTRSYTSSPTGHRRATPDVLIDAHLDSRVFMSKVTVVVATRNRRVVLCRTVERLLALPDRPAAVVVVDNASDDGTSAVLGERFPDVRV